MEKTQNETRVSPGVNVVINGLEKGLDAFGQLVAKATKNENESGKTSKHEGQANTFNDKRACIYCGEPLADQLSKKRIYCEEQRGQNGSLTKDCKGAYNRQKNKPEVDMHREIINEHKTIDERIDAMVAKKGYEVTTQDLNAYDIILDSPLRYEFSSYGILTTYFLKYTIISNPVFNSHKILHNGQQ